MWRSPWCLLVHVFLLGSPSALFAQIAAPIPAPPAQVPGRPPIPLSIVDSRPGWERHSKDCAVDFVALENAPDPPWSVLADALQQETNGWADRPCQATLELHSFRVVSKESAGEHWGFPLFPTGGIHPNAGNARNALGYVAVIAVVLTAEGVYCLGRETVDLVTGCRRSVKGPPYTLGDEYQSGITCEIKGCLVLCWPDGRQQPAEIVGIANTDSRGKDASPYLWDDIEAMVQTATRQLAQDWMRQNSLRVANP